MFATRKRRFAGYPGAMDESGAIPAEGFDLRQPIFGDQAPPADHGDDRMILRSTLAPNGQGAQPMTRLAGRPAGMFGPPPRLNFAEGVNQALADNAAMEPKGHKGLFPGKDWKTVVGKILPAAINGYLAGLGNPAGLQNMRAMQEESQLRARLQAEAEQERQKAMQPKFEQIGNTGGMFDPVTQVYNPIFTAPQPFEIYARSLGYEPGSEEYHQAVEDYRAGTWGDEGVAGRLTVQQPRLDQSNINNIRSTSTSRENNIRSTGVSRENSIRSTGQSDTNNRRSTGQSNTNNVRSTNTSRENADQRSHDYRMSPGFRGKARPTGRTATKRETGERLQELSDGRWVPIQ